MDQEKLFRASLIERQINELESRLEMINQHISELNQFQEYLDIFSKSSNNEMLSSIGKGVYAKTKLLSKDLLVEVGAGVVIKKNPEEMKNVIESQLSKFAEVKSHIMAETEAYAQSLQDILREIEFDQRDSKN